MAVAWEDPQRERTYDVLGTAVVVFFVLFVIGALEILSLALAASVSVPLPVPFSFP